MNGPSLDAIRKFKQLQEKKKEEERIKFNQNKLSTLEHRAAQGDKKAKKLLKIIDQAKREPEPGPGPRITNEKNSKSPVSIKPKLPEKAPKKDLSFEELMQLAKQNKNQPGKPQDQQKSTKNLLVKPQDQQSGLKKSTCDSQVQSQERKLKHERSNVREKKFKCNHCDKAFIEKHELTNHLKLHEKNQKPIKSPAAVNFNKPTSSSKLPNVRSANVIQKKNTVRTERVEPVKFKQPTRSIHRPYINRASNYEDDEEEDDDDMDDFIDDDEDDYAQSELSKTLRSVFGYDRQKYARREALLDAEYEREYRAIGKVQTFEDLEREERRSAKLAAREDKEAELEEERRRAKKLKLKSKGKL